jgi:hypothetical protein
MTPRRVQGWRAYGRAADGAPWKEIGSRAATRGDLQLTDTVGANALQRLRPLRRIDGKFHGSSQPRTHHPVRHGGDRKDRWPVLDHFRGAANAHHGRGAGSLVEVGAVEIHNGWHLRELSGFASLRVVRGTFKGERRVEERTSRADVHVHGHLALSVPGTRLACAIASDTYLPWYVLPIFMRP